jgi:hypothetical protein
MTQPLAQHVESLCAQHDIQIVERRSYGGVAFKRQRIISIRPVKTQRTYIVALHEIGHIVGRNRSGTRLEQEAAAWDFVISHSIVPLSAGTYGQMLKYLNSYLVRACRTRRMVVPQPEHRFWSTYALIQSRAALS